MLLFSPHKIGAVEIKNRFVHSATYEGVAKYSGEVTDLHIKRYRAIAKGGVGLIIPGYMYVHPSGKPHPHGTGIYDDSLIPGLQRLSETIHRHGSKVFFQLKHSGQQTTPKNIGRTPWGPSSAIRDPLNLFKPHAMTENEIEEIIDAFGKAAERATEAGADGVQLHAAHGHLLTQFLSPFFNHRTDAWGGSDEKRFKFLREVFLAVKSRIPSEMPVIVKLNAHDYTPKEGITPPLAAKYARWLADLGINGLEISCGSAVFSFLSTCRGEVPIKELLERFAFWKRLLIRPRLKQLERIYSFQENFNLEAARVIKPALNKIPLLLVGGMRRVSEMEKILSDRDADFISMSRPFIRDPYTVKKIADGKIDRVACVNCNKCLAAMPNDMPVRCYNSSWPKKT